MPNTRRRFLRTLAAGAVVPLLAPRLVRGAPLLRTDTARLRRDLEALSAFGRPAGGTFASGVSRLGYSEADVAGRRLVMDLMRGAGLTPRVDPAGNILATRPGRDRLPPILFGSHIDSVPNGGNFDGDLGTLAAIEAVRLLDAGGITTRHPLEVVMWTNEEGVAYGNGLCGSRAASGHLVEGELGHVWNGVVKADAIRAVGGDPARIAEARRPATGSFHGYFELHIEQGGNLDRERIPIGVVEGIVCIERFQSRVRGTANHAGTTAMVDRHDALVAASRLTLAVNEIVRAEPGRQVGTVGELHVSPNAPNVVPGEVVHSIELRDLSAEKVKRLGDAIKARADAIAKEVGVRIDITSSSFHEPALATPSMQQAVERAASSLGLRSKRLPSGAGHDAQMMATLGPMGMIFVPSVNGVSHSPTELTTWDDCANGANALLQAVLEIDEVERL